MHIFGGSTFYRKITCLRWKMISGFRASGKEVHEPKSLYSFYLSFVKLFEMVLRLVFVENFLSDNFSFGQNAQLVNARIENLNFKINLTVFHSIVLKMDCKRPSVLVFELAS